MEAVEKPVRRKKPATALATRPTKAPTATEELSADQTPTYQVEVVDPMPLAVAVRPSLIPERVVELMEFTSKLQFVVGGIGLVFAAAAAVVHRHEQRYHGEPIDPTPPDEL